MTRMANRLILTIFLLAAGPGSLFARDSWQFVSDDSSVALYSREVAGHEESEFKGITVVNQPIEVIGAVLAEIPSYPGWFYDCREALKITQVPSSAHNFMIYIAVNTPWPLWPRDIVYDVNIRIDIPPHRVEVRCGAVSEPLIPLREDHVRITDSELHWILESIDPHRTRITFIMRTDAGGAVSGYWTDFGNRKTIYHSLLNLHTTAAQPKYKALGRELIRAFTENK